MPKSAVWAGESIDRFIPPQLRNTFYKNSNARCKYARNNGIGAYDFVTNGLVLYLPLWALNNGGTNSIQSVDAFKRICAVTGATWGIRGRTFDTTDDVITTPLTIAGDATMLVWFNPTATRDYASILRIFVDASNIIVITNSAAATSRRYYGALTVAGVTNQTFASTNTPAVAGTPAFLGFTFSDGDNLLSSYYNGNLEMTLATTLSMNFTGTVGVGLASNGTIGAGWIYNRVLTAGEILRIYLATGWRY